MASPIPLELGQVSDPYARRALEQMSLRGDGGGGGTVGPPGPTGPPGGDAILLDERADADPTAFYTRTGGTGALAYNPNAGVPGQAYLTMDAVGNDGYFQRNDSTLDVNIRNPLHAIEVQFNAGSGTPLYALRFREQSDRWVIVQVNSGNLIIFTSAPGALDVNRAAGAATLSGVGRAWLIGGVFHDTIFAAWTRQHPMGYALVQGSGLGGQKSLIADLSGLADFNTDANRTGRARTIRVSPGGSDLANHRVYRHMVMDLDKLPALGGGGGVASGGAGGADKNYVHTQGSPSSSWAVAHNLGKYPAVDVVDTGGSAVIPDVFYSDTNNATLNFGSPTSGKAFAN